MVLKKLSKIVIPEIPKISLKEILQVSRKILKQFTYIRLRNTLMSYFCKLYSRRNTME